MRVRGKPSSDIALTKRINSIKGGHQATRHRRIIFVAFHLYASAARATRTSCERTSLFRIGKHLASSRRMS